LDTRLDYRRRARDWELEEPPLSAFLLQLLVFEAAIGAEHGASVAWLDRPTLARVLEPLQPLPFGAWRWPGYPSAFYAGDRVVAFVGPNPVPGETGATNTSASRWARWMRTPWATSKRSQRPNGSGFRPETTHPGAGDLAARKPAVAIARRLRLRKAGVREVRVVRLLFGGGAVALRRLVHGVLAPGPAGRGEEPAGSAAEEPASGRWSWATPDALSGR
jgi:hypothetical protein